VISYETLSAVQRAEGAGARRIQSLPAAAQRMLAGTVPAAIDGQTLDPTLRAVLGSRERRGIPELGSGPLDAARERFVTEIVATEGPQPRVYDVRELTVPGPAGPLGARLYSPPPAEEGVALLVHYHGGGHVLGDLDSCETACRILVRHAGVAVLSVDYRLAPEHPFPAAADDALAAFDWAAANAAELGADPDRIAVGGDSAGGNLAAATCLAARDGGGATPAFQLLIYPAVDIGTRRRSRELFAERLLLTEEEIAWFREQYVPDPADLATPQASPLLADDLAGLPPAYVTTAGFDPLRDEGEEFAAALSRAGVTVAYRCHDTLVHGFANLTAVVPAAREAMLEAAGALRMGLAARKS